MMGELMFTTVDYVFFIALAFTILALLSERSRAFLCMASAVSWIVLAAIKYVSEAPTSVANASLSIFFFGLGVVMLIYAIQLTLEMLYSRRFEF